MTLTFTRADQIAPEIAKLLSQGLTVHAADVGYPTEWQEYSILARDEHGEIIAGVCGNSGQGAINIRLLWVDSKHRKQGLGKKLLRMAEELGLQRGCHTAFLDTFSFQGPAYYPKFGYVKFGELDGLGPKRDLTRTWFAKRLQ